MKNITQIIFILLLITTKSYCQQEKGIVGKSNWLNHWTEFETNKKDYGEPTQILSGNITENKTLLNTDVYLLVGDVFVSNNATLTIQPGTVIFGDYKSKGTLTITKGSKLIAEGTETNPIVFTSKRDVKRAGDWGGIVILGSAANSKFGNGSLVYLYNNLKSSEYAKLNYGGNDTINDSGILKNVRIEYAGKRVGNQNYFSGLLLASVGKETKISKVMVSHAAGNSFEILGGEIELNQMVSYKSDGNDFMFNYGAAVQLKNSMAVRSPYNSNVNGSRCLKIASYNKIEEFDFSKRKTHVMANNLTLLNESENLKADISMNLVREAIYVGQNAVLNMGKSVVSGFNPAVVLDEKITVNQESLEHIKFSEMYFNNCNGNIFVENNLNNEDLENWYGNSAFFNVYSKSTDAETFINIRDKRRPDYRLRINKIIASNEVDPDLRMD